MTNIVEVLCIIGSVLSVALSALYWLTFRTEAATRLVTLFLFVGALLFAARGNIAASTNNLLAEKRDIVLGLTIQERYDRLGTLYEDRLDLTVPHFWVSGKVLQVKSGTTFRLLSIDGKEQDVTLALVQIPETKEFDGLDVNDPVAEAARRDLEVLLARQNVSVMVQSQVSKDKFNRLVGFVFLGDVLVNKLIFTYGKANIHYNRRPLWTIVRDELIREMESVKHK